MPIAGHRRGVILAARARSQPPDLLWRFRQRPGTIRWVAADRDWAHDPAFDGESMAEFERRLGRARTESRPGYMRVKGATLLELENVDATEVAIELLTRVVTQYDHFLDVPWAHELLGEAYRRQGDLDQAEHHLCRCIETADERRNGTTKITELSLGEVLLEQGRVEEAGQMLAAQEPRWLAWNSHIFRYAVARARYEDRVGGRPGEWARKALEVASNTKPQLPRLPDLGVVKPSRSTLREMKLLARRS